MSRVVSKSKLMGGFQCQKLLYYQIHKPKWARPNTQEEQLLFDQGHEVGAEARKRFPGGRLITAPAWEFDQALRDTAQSMSGTLFEGAFQNGPLFVRVDILEQVSDGWNLIEVKSSVTAKEENIIDCGIQYAVLKGLGIPIQKVILMYLNRNCTAPNLGNLFVAQDITDLIKSKDAEIKKSIRDFLATLKEPQLPQVQAGLQCDRPYECRFKEQCWNEQLIPPSSVLNLPDIKYEKRWELFYQGSTFDSLDPGEFSEITQRALKAHNSGEAVILRDRIAEELKNWKRPFWFLDFESIGFAIPRFNGTKPYQQIPFQYSLHIQSEKNGGLRHEEFLDTSGNDPREKLIHKLLEDIGPEGDIVSYYANFEKMVITDLASAFPQYEEKLKALMPRFRDPLPLIRNSIYIPEFRGSFSLKNVGPAIVGKEFDYRDLRVQSGAMAQAAYLKIAKEPSEELRGALREYCARDTLIMVRLLDKLLDWVS